MGRVRERSGMSDHAVPNLPSRDLDDTRAFYGRFGFEQEYRDAGWLILCRGELRLNAPGSSSTLTGHN